MRILIIGGGGREHALARKLSQSPRVETIFCIPGNAGIAAVAHCFNEDMENLPALATLALKNKVDLTIVGPEAPLVAGIVDYFWQEGLTILGPERKAALLEGSKVWAKEFMVESGIPTAGYEVFSTYQAALDYVRHQDRPLVIKADGLAAGKGVYVTNNTEEADMALQQIMIDKIYGDAGNRVVVEEKLQGEEASLLALTDGSDFWVMPSSQDHKPIGEGDSGPNTGGMGAYSPAPVMTPARTKYVEEKVFTPLIEGMQRKSLNFRGVIYAGLMITEDGPKVLEFNVRFGDPETQAILPRLDSDLASVLLSAAEGKLEGDWQWKDEAAVCVVMASGGYPGSYEKGKVIKGLDNATQEPGVFVFHSGTAKEGEYIVTAGGRVLSITALETGLKEAVDAVYRAVDKIDFEGAYYRRDIAHRAL